MLEQKLQQKAEELGFAALAILPAGETPYSDTYARFIDQGFQGKMSYLERHKELKADIRNLRPWAKSIVVFLYSYHTKDLPVIVREDPSRGILAQYAWGPDYHDVLNRKLEVLAKWMREEMGDNIQVEPAVDAKPVGERSWAAAGGLGHIGKNGNLINYQWGSTVFLSEMFVGKALIPMTHKTVSSCGFCTACKDACPTNAIVEDGMIDARKCISYLTIELRGEIPEEFRKAIGNRIFGCDTCQDVCPWNSKKRPSSDPFLSAEVDIAAPKLEDLASLTPEEFDRRYKNTPISRAGYEGFMRNVAVALGNWGTIEAAAILRTLERIENDIVQTHVKWGLQQCESVE